MGDVCLALAIMCRLSLRVSELSDLMYRASKQVHQPVKLHNFKIHVVASGLFVWGTACVYLYFLPSWRLSGSSAVNLMSCRTCELQVSHRHRT